MKEKWLHMWRIRGREREHECTLCCGGIPSQSNKRLGLVSCQPVPQLGLLVVCISPDENGVVLGLRALGGKS